MEREARRLGWEIEERFIAAGKLELLRKKGQSTESE
jgi:hypothetical protein